MSFRLTPTGNPLLTNDSLAHSMATAAKALSGAAPHWWNPASPPCRHTGGMRRGSPRERETILSGNRSMDPSLVLRRLRRGPAARGEEPGQRAGVVTAWSVSVRRDRSPLWRDSLSRGLTQPPPQDAAILTALRPPLKSFPCTTCAGEQPRLRERVHAYRPAPPEQSCAAPRQGFLLTKHFA